MMKEAIHQEDIILNGFVPINHRTSKYMKQKLIHQNKTKDKFTVGIRDFNTALTVIDRQIRQKIVTYIRDLNNTTNIPDLINTEDSIQYQQNIDFLQMYMEHSPDVLVS